MYFGKLEKAGVLERSADRDVVDFPFTERGKRFLDFLRTAENTAS